MKLTEHFTLHEFERSATAEKYHIDKDFWIHVSCRKNRRANRHQVIRYLKK